MEQKNVTIHLTRRVLVMLWVLLIVPWVLVVFLSLHRTSDVLQLKISHPSGQEMSVSRPGPWGTLEYKRIVLEPPDEYVDLHDATSRELRWFFKGKSRVEVEQYLNTIGLTAPQLATLHGAWMDGAAGTYLQPSADFVWNLNADVRSRLYGLLGQSEENERQSNPYRYRADKVEEWLEDSGLRAETVQLVRRFLYQRGTGMAFADMDLVSPRLPNDAERIRLLNVLTRRAALQVRLRIAEGMDVQPLTEYWGSGGRTKDILPTLESFTRQHGGGNVSIFLLLPKFARTLLNTYPLSLLGPNTAPQNCHWTSLNFFRDQPDERFATVEGATKELIENYYEIVAQPRLGDVLAFTEPSGGVIHSCVYIADDIVFTKNGISMSTPWILMSLADVSAYYTGTPEMRIRIYRPKGRLG